MLLHADGFTMSELGLELQLQLELGEGMAKQGQWVKDVLML